ncbi:hypothetical protein [Bacillus alkalicellulosilyticus]|uniref:hypothetical protein n=1 Tax=Alkalihalobacterium alkalicellulosilyticum TaxID=1912214 RepID=UPI0009967738|nr:hypothetical protein [Bacillus alkalicellulosilyticus]
MLLIQLLTLIFLTTIVEPPDWVETEYRVFVYDSSIEVNGYIEATDEPFTYVQYVNYGTPWSPDYKEEAIYFPWKEYEDELQELLNSGEIVSISYSNRPNQEEDFVITITDNKETNLQVYNFEDLLDFVNDEEQTKNYVYILGFIILFILVLLVVKLYKK